MNKKQTTELQAAIVDAAGTTIVTRAELCRKFDITPQTLNNWLRADYHFNDALREAERQAMGREVPQALKALRKIIDGYTLTTTKERYSINEKGERVLQSVIVETKQVPPDTSAVAAILKAALPHLFP